MKNSLKVLIATFAIVALSAQVYAATEPTGAVVSGETDYGQYDQGAAGTVTGIESGNITGADLGANMSTYRWAGLTGDTSGDIILADVTNATMYTWTAEGRVVYASTAAAPDWANLAAATVTQIVASASYAAATDKDVDRWNNTFTGNSNLESEIFSGVGAAPICETQDETGATPWTTWSLHDAGGNLVWAGNVTAGDTNYNGTIVDYQMIIPEDGTGGDETPDTYYLWVELR